MNHNQLYSKSIQKINGSTKLRTLNSNSEKIAAGEMEDDYTNHFHSHFGFFDVPYPLDMSRAKSIILTHADPKRGDNTYAQIHNESSKPSSRAKV